jgi:hypothetical protein
VTTPHKERPFDDLEPDPAAPPVPDWLWGPGAWRGKRPNWATAVAGIFLLNAISTVLYAGMLPQRLPLLPDPLPWLGLVLGGLALLAAAGVFRGLEWGRWLAIAVAVSWSARTAALIGAWAEAPSDPTGTSVLLDFVLPLAINGLILWLLLVRWPRAAT